MGNPILVAMGILSIGYYSMQAAYSGHAFRLQLTKILGVVAMLYIFLLPTTEMFIFDHVSKKKEKVDNIPLGFALPVAILESFGNILTGGFERVFSTVGSTSYREAWCLVPG